MRAWKAPLIKRESVIRESKIFAGNGKRHLSWLQLGVFIDWSENHYVLVGIAGVGRYEGSQLLVPRLGRFLALDNSLRIKSEASQEQELLVPASYRPGKAP